MFATAGSPGARPRSPTLSGARPEYWVGRRVLEIIPPEDEAAFAARLATLCRRRNGPGTYPVVAVDGVTHWADVHARPLRDDAGRQDGFTAALRLVDDEVAAQQDAKGGPDANGPEPMPHTGDQWTVRRSGCAWSTPRAASLLTSTRRW